MDTERYRYNPKPNVDRSTPLLSGRPIDWLLFAMAMVSLGLVLWLNIAHSGPGWLSVSKISPEERLFIRIVDCTVCSIFAGEFFWRWYLAKFSVRYLARNWYAFLGMIPVSLHFMLGHPLWRGLLIFARFGRAIDRVLGDGFTTRVINRVKDPIVGQISGMVTIAMLDRVADVLSKGTYTKNIARALAENETDLRLMVMEKIKADPKLKRLSFLPYHDVIAESVIDAVLRVTEEFLKDPRTDALVADMLRENLQQLRAAVAEQEAERESLLDELRGTHYARPEKHWDEP